jgi:hypothetical protein
MITQLNPPLPLETPKGSGLAHFVIDYGPEADLLWVVFLDDGGACWSVPNPDIRLSSNWSMGRARQADLPDAKGEAGAGNVRAFPRATES